MLALIALVAAAIVFLAGGLYLSIAMGLETTATTQDAGTSLS